MKLRKVKKENEGFALLFSVLVSSLLLTIGLSILNISIKELAISTASKQSIYAFYAADSGREYTLYHDTKIGDASTFDVSSIVPLQSVTSAPATDMLVDPTDPSGPNFSVTMIKTWAIFGEKVKTTIDSVGHNSDGGDRVERAIQQTY